MDWIILRGMDQDWDKLKIIKLDLLDITFRGFDVDGVVIRILNVTKTLVQS